MLELECPGSIWDIGKQKLSPGLPALGFHDLRGMGAPGFTGLGRTPSQLSTALQDCHSRGSTLAWPIQAGLGWVG